MSVKFSEAVEKVIAEVCPPRDPFDSADFDPVEYLNCRFPDEGSLSALPAFLDETANRLRQTENELLKAVESQTSGASIAEEDLRNAKSSVAALYTRVSNIKDKAAKSESTVRDLCQHIRELDIAKTNLNLSISTLRSLQLWMLQLQSMSSALGDRRYIKFHDALQEAQKFSTMFDSMKELPKIKELNDKQGQLCRQMEYHIRNTIFDEFTFDSIEENVMAEACSIINLLGEESIKKIRDRFVEKVLETYTMRFKRGSEDAKLDKTERRYAYIRNLLTQNENLFLNVFPRHWCVPHELCVTFCLKTKVELDHLLREAEGNIDIAVLTFVLQKTIDLERDLTQMMMWKEEFPGRHELPTYKFNGMILVAFKEQMHLFISSEDKLMGEALAQPLTGEGDNIAPGWANDEQIRVGSALPIAEDLFVFIKESLRRTIRISQQDVLLDMSAVWKHHLIRFSEAISTLLVPAAVSPSDIRRTCIVINTADLCQSTCQDLGGEVSARSGAPAKEVGFDLVVESFSTLYSKGVQSIVQGVLTSFHPLLTEYSNGRFMDNRNDETDAQDESPLIRNMSSILRDVILTCANVLPIPLLRFLLDKIASNIIPSYTNCLYRLRQLSDVGPGLMRVDSAALERTFLQLPNYNDPNRFEPHMLTSYIKLVRREFDQLNRALKVLQVDVQGNTFVDLYFEVILPEDRSIQNFVRLVELKGFRRENIRPWVASLSKRGVVEATHRDLQRESALGVATGASTLANNSGGVGTSSGSGFTAAFSNLLGTNSTPMLRQDPIATGASAKPSGPNTTEGGIGSRFAKVATSINFLNQFKK